MFSEKYGYKAEQKIQLETASPTLSQRIWNLFYQEEIHEGGLSNERITRAMTGKQTVEEKVILSLQPLRKGSDFITALLHYPQGLYRGQTKQQSRHDCRYHFFRNTNHIKIPLR